MIDTDSAEFTEAFVTAARPGEPRGRPGWLMIMIAVGVVFAVALASLLNGALSTTPTLTTWTVLAGPGCTSSAASFSETGFYAGDGTKASDWTTARAGGYHGLGCSGAFVSVPLSGDAKAYDSSRYAVWTFRLSSELPAKVTCRIFTYVPGDKTLAAVGGVPAHYYYYASAYRPGATKPAGEYAVNQVKYRGTWVRNSALTVTSGQVSVRLVDAGAPRGARAAAAQVRLTCAAP
jgi:hypothetical protein